MSQIAPFDTQFAHDIYAARYQHPRDLNWAGTAGRLTSNVLGALRETPSGAGILWDDDTMARVFDLIAQRRFMPGGRYLYATGRDLHQVNNCVLLRAEDSREGWAETSYRSLMALMTGAGIGVWYGDVRAAGSPITRTGGTASGPLSLMQVVNEQGRHVMQGGNRRSAIWAGLPWSHPDVFEFLGIKDWDDATRAAKAADWNHPAPLDFTNISVTLDDEFFAAYGDPRHPMHSVASRVYMVALAQMLAHGEPGFTVDTGDQSDEVLRNACTEITSADDSDVCNLGSLVLPKFSTPEQFESAVRDAVLFLTAGSVYSDVPYEKVAEVRERNRRLGLGLIGVHEFCMKHGVRYGTDESMEVLAPYMEAYSRGLEFAHDWQDRAGITHSKGATAIAPNGTIGIVAESTPSADPLFFAAEVRTVKSAAPGRQDTFDRHVVIDPTAKRMLAEGVPADLIEDSHTLAMFPERRFAMTAFLQGYTDHAISGTVNLPAPITDSTGIRVMADTLMEYLPHMRGITMYPDGARAGQPRTPVDLEWALAQGEVVLDSETEVCGLGGACGV
jgi:ribonucleoside-diphosphate reductase alpha chain